MSWIIIIALVYSSVNLVSSFIERCSEFQRVHSSVVTPPYIYSQ